MTGAARCRSKRCGYVRRSATGGRQCDVVGKYVEVYLPVAAQVCYECVQSQARRHVRPTARVKARAEECGLAADHALMSAMTAMSWQLTSICLDGQMSVT